MPTIKTIVIPADDNQPLRIEEFERNDLAKMQELVGGPLEAIGLDNPRSTMMVNEEASYLPMGHNERATLVLRTMQPAFLTEPELLGDAFILGVPTSAGNDTSAPEVLFKIFFEAQRFAVEYQRQEGGEWKRMRLRPDNWTLAHLLAVYVLTEFEAIASVRVMPV